MPELPSRLAAAALAELPAYLPPRAVRQPNGLTLGDVDKGDLIAVEGRWATILGCTCVNGWVTLRLNTDRGQLTAHKSKPVHLARKDGADASALATGQ